MDLGIKAVWLKALRSGEYDQIKGQLKCDGGFCCLGVLSDIHAKTTGGEWEDMYYLGNSGLPPQQVVDWSGLSDTDPVLEYNGEARHISELNDEINLSFNQIANLIEEQLQ